MRDARKSHHLRCGIQSDRTAVSAELVPDRQSIDRDGLGPLRLLHRAAGRRGHPEGAVAAVMPPERDPLCSQLFGDHRQDPIDELLQRLLGDHQLERAAKGLRLAATQEPEALEMNREEVG